MSIVAIRAALEIALAAITPPLRTVWENRDDSPAAGSEYQAAYLLPAEPDNPEIGRGYIQRGIFQVNLFYPQGKGWLPISQRAEMIRSAFPRALALQNAGVIVTVLSTPEIGPGRAEDDLFFMPVKVRWSAQFFGG